VQTPVGFKCEADARGARVIFGYDYLKSRRATRTAVSILVWTLPLLVLVVLRVGIGGGGGSSVIVAAITSVATSIALSFGLRWLARRF
jgi:hypothetical protein